MTEPPVLCTAHDVPLAVFVTPVGAATLPEVGVDTVVHTPRRHRQDVVGVPPLGAIRLAAGITRAVDAQTQETEEPQIGETLPTGEIAELVVAGRMITP